MKRSIVLLTIFLISCAPQVTVTSDVTVTSTPPPAETPIPTPTFHPQFIALQESIASSGERFTLQADGTIQDGAETIPGINVSSDGMISLTVGGETVVLDPADVNFDDENGIVIDGFELTNENDAWVEAMSEAQLEWKGIFEANGYQFTNDKVVAPNGNVVPGLHMDGDKLVITYAFPELGGDSISVSMTKDGIRFGYNLGLDTIRFREDGTLNMPGLRFDGEQVVQEKVLYNGRETNEPLLPIEVVMELIRRDTAKYVEKYGESVLHVDSEMRDGSSARWKRLTGIESLSDRTVVFKGMTFTRAVDGVWSNNFYVVDEDGKPIRSEDGKVLEIPTLFYSRQEFTDGQSMVTWETVDGNQVWYMVDGSVGNIQYSKKNDVSVFVVEQSEIVD